MKKENHNGAMFDFSDCELLACILKSQIIYVFRFVDHIVSVAAIQLCYYNKSSHRHYMKEWVCLFFSEIYL